MPKIQTRSVQEVQAALASLVDRALELSGRELFAGKGSAQQALDVEKIALDQELFQAIEGARLEKIHELEQLNINLQAQRAESLQNAEKLSAQAQEAFSKARAIEGERLRAATEARDIGLTVAHQEQVIRELSTAENKMPSHDEYWIGKAHVDRLIAQIQWNATDTPHRLFDIDVSGSDAAIGELAELGMTAPAAVITHIKQRVSDLANARTARVLTM